MKKRFSAFCSWCLVRLDVRVRDAFNGECESPGQLSFLSVYSGHGVVRAGSALLTAAMDVKAIFAGILVKLTHS